MTKYGDPVPPELGRAMAANRDRLGLVGARILFFHTIGSTNDLLMAAVSGGEETPVVIAGTQTAGRGRHGRAWFSPPGSGLYVSLVLTLPADGRDSARATSLLTLSAAVALAEAIEGVAALRAAIKWPNDLLLANRKVAGILAERGGRMSAGGSGATREDVKIVVGFGINVSTHAFPPELADRATSLEAERGAPIDRAVLCVESLAAISRRHGDLLAGRFDAILDAWRERAPQHQGARVAWSGPDGRQEGVTAGIDATGALLVRAGDRIERIVGGEVTWL